jgi:hypothetical protein
MGYPKYENVTLAYEYDFAVDGGAVSAIPLRKLGVNGLGAGLVIKNATVLIETELASGSGTATVGYTGEVDAYFKDLVATAAGGYSALSQLGGDKLQSSVTADDGMGTVDALADDLNLALSAANVPLLTVGTGALTAGKFKIVFECVAI